jgi:type IV pilus assembly protein PilB
MPKKRIGDLLIERGLITESELQFALDTQKQTKEKLGEVLVNNNIVSPENMAKTLAVQLEVDYVDLAKMTLASDLADIVQKNTAKKKSFSSCSEAGRYFVCCNG